jgi:general transcription factor 3C polypeptide 5 (transcription factor C subunit 1)
MSFTYRTASQSSLPSHTFHSVEYPGYVKTPSVPHALVNMGGQERLETAFKRSAKKEDMLLELHLRPEDPFAHPIAGEIVSTSGVIVKVVKKKRKRPMGEDVTPDTMTGHFTVAPVGIVAKTARFRGIKASFWGTGLLIVLQPWLIFNSSQTERTLFQSCESRWII